MHPDDEQVESCSQRTDDFLKKLSTSDKKKKKSKKVDYPGHQKPVSAGKGSIRKRIKDRANKVIRKADFRLACMIHAKKKVDPLEMKARQIELLKQINDQRKEEDRRKELANPKKTQAKLDDFLKPAAAKPE